MSKLRKTLRNVVLSMVFLLPLLGYAVYQSAPYLIIKPRKMHYTKRPTDFGMEAKDLSLTAADSIKLVGWATFPPDRDSSKPVIVFLHGIGNNKETWVSTAAKLYKMGIPSIAFDGRAHGESGGTYCTFGHLEKKDVQRIAVWAAEAYPNQNIGLWGNSLGGAVALQSLEYDKNLKFGIITSTFAEMEEVVLAYQTRYFLGYQNETIAKDALTRAADIAHFEPDSIHPEESAKHIEQAIFYAHGTKDNNIDVSNAHRIYDNLASKEKEIHLVEGATHFDLWKTGGMAYESALFSFLKKQGKTNLITSESKSITHQSKAQ